MSTAKEYWQLQGAKGNAGTDGSDGSDGSNAFTATTAQFTMPAENSTVVVSVSDSSWAAIGQLVYVEGAGYMEVSAKPAATQITLKNVEATASSAYTSNVAPGTTVASGKRVSPAGLQGPSGAAGSDYTADDELNAIAGLTSAADRVPYFTGSGTAALANFTAVGRTIVAASTVSAAQQAMSVEVGVDVQAYDADLAAIAGVTSAADKVPYFTGSGAADVADFTATGRSIVAAANAAAVRTAISAAGSGANSDITSITGLTTALTTAQGGTGVAALPSFSVNLNGSDQTGVVTATPTKLAFATEVFDTETDFDTSTNRFTPTVAGKYAFTVAAQVNALAATGDIVQVHLYKNGTKVATGKAITPDAADNVQAMVHFVASANGSTDYFEAYVEHDAGANKDVEGDEEVTFFCGHWCGE